METIAGGISKIEFDDNDSFLTPTEIKLPLKEGTSLLPITESEEDAEGHDDATIKEMDVSIRSADNDDSVGSAYRRLSDAEEARASLAFRFWLLSGKVLVVRNVVQSVTRELNEFGKFNSLDIYGVGSAETESALWELIELLKGLLIRGVLNDVGAIVYAPSNMQNAVTASDVGAIVYAPSNMQIGVTAS
jgi:hypothetical protein